MEGTNAVRFLVCGGRKFSNFNIIGLTTDQLKEKFNEWFFIWKILNDFVDEGDVIISGMAVGADTCAAQYAKFQKMKLLEFPADWNKYGKSAGPIRNQQMLDEGRPDLVIAFPGGTGTTDMIRRAKKAGIEVREIEYNNDTI